MEYIAFDSHKRYTFASVEEHTGNILQEGRIEHRRGAVKRFLAPWKPGTPVAVETVGNWYWIVDEVEAAGMKPQLVHARKAKLMSGMVNKTDKLDCHGLNRLQRKGTLPTVWIPPAEIRDQRDLPRTRMVLSKQRTAMKNRIQATLAKYGLSVEGVSDPFGKRGLEELRKCVRQLPPHTRFCVDRLLELLLMVQQQISGFEKMMKATFSTNEELELLQTLPGVGFILSLVIALEVGDVKRFPECSRLSSYSGTTPRVHASGGKVRYGPLRQDVNRYLKWAFIEAANVVCMHRHKRPFQHVSRLYEKIRRKKGHQKAVGAVARHLAEATYWILKRKVPYREPCQKRVPNRESPKRVVSSTRG